MSKYRKKPVVIEAVQYVGRNCHVLASWVGELATVVADGSLVIHTLEGDMRVSLGDFVIKGVQGEFYPCKPDIFAATYEPVED